MGARLHFALTTACLCLGLIAVSTGSAQAQTAKGQGGTTLCAEVHQDDAAGKVGVAFTRCDGAQVRLFGAVPDGGAPAMPPMIMQHPVLTTPALDGPIPGKNEAEPRPDSHQSYLNIGGRQVILLSAGPLACDPPRWVEGRLESIDFGGPRDTKLGYRGWAIHVTDHACP